MGNAVFPWECGLFPWESCVPMGNCLSHGKNMGRICDNFPMGKCISHGNLIYFPWELNIFPMGKINIF
jgi:hypothetical protein